MTRPLQKHLDDVEIDALLSTSPDPAEVSADPPEVAMGMLQRHVESCEDCRRRVQMHRRVQSRIFAEGLAGQPEGSAPCQREVNWLDVAAGVLPQAQIRALMSHAAICEHCGRGLRQAAEFLSDDATLEEERALAGLRTSQPEWRQTLADRLVSENIPRESTWSFTRLMRSFGSFLPEMLRRRPAYAGALCALLLVLVWLGWSTLRLRSNISADVLLAKAYTEQRTLEMRIPDAQYAPMSIRRGYGGSNLDRPSSLLKAESIIGENLSHHPGDPFWLTAKGRADLLDGNYESAIKSLNEAMQQNTDSVPLKIDLASAYFERAESTNRTVDYGTAIEWLDRALAQKTDERVALFNRAIVYERLFLYDQAVQDWEHYLRVDSRGGWATEARSRLAALRKKINGRTDSSVPTVEDPSSAISSLTTIPTFVRTADDDLADQNYLQAAITVWLPSAYSPISKDHDASLKALILLGSLLRTHHGDEWVSDFLKAPAGESLQGAVRLLGAASAANVSGDNDRAVVWGRRAAVEFRTAGNRAGELWSRFEVLYALKRSQRGHDCLSDAEDLLAALDGRRYAWVRIQTLLEQANCLYMVGRPDPARAITQTAQREAQNAGYGVLYLRALGFEAGLESARGNMRSAWQLDCAGLAHYWAGHYETMRAWQFYSDMGYHAEESAEWHLATALAREAVSAIAASRRPGEEARAHFRLATDAVAAGETAEAAAEFERAEHIYATLPQSESVRAFETDGELALAELDLSRGATEQALLRLGRVRARLASIQSYTIPLRYYETLGKLHFWRSEDEQAEAALRPAALITEFERRSLVDEGDRLIWERESSEVYRYLAGLLLLHRNNPVEALRVWESHRSSAFRAGNALDRRISAQAQEIPFSTLETQALPAYRELDEVRASLYDATIVSYAWLPNGLETWVFNDQGIHSHWEALPQQTFEPVARRFTENCANPQSSLQTIASDGNQLYAWLFSPIETLLSKDRRILIEADGPIGLIPLHALSVPSGGYLGERWTILALPTIRFWKPSRQNRTSLTHAKALVVGVPGGFAEELPPLPEALAEAKMVANRFENRTVLLGNAATLDAVRHRLSDANVFHFSGHSIAGTKRTGLMLPAGTSTMDADLLDAAAIRQSQLRNCRLVVLSACSTAKPAEAIVDPEDLVGAFLSAGASSVVASRWNVDSAATISLMDAFYSHLIQGDAVAVALQLAEAEIRSKPNTSHPYFWAAFSAFGSS